MAPDRQSPFAQWLGATMETRGLTQADVAREVGVADVQVSRWRRGQVRPSVNYLQRIADTFDVPRASLEHLVGYPTGVDMPASGARDPQVEAELQAYQTRYRQLIEQNIPRRFWRVYVEACEALAEELGASFEETVERTRKTVRQERREVAGKAERHMGFHRPVPEECDEGA